MDRSPKNKIILTDITTNNLKNVTVEIPHNAITVICGVSGSGKTSLAFGSLYSEAYNRYVENFSAYTRSIVKMAKKAKIASCEGLIPAVAISRKFKTQSARSTVGTMTGIYDLFRLLYSRKAQFEGKDITAGHFSFNNHLGACPNCEGLGSKLICSSDLIICNPNKPLLEGAFSSNKSAKYYGDPYGQFMAVVKEIAKTEKINLSVPWAKLPDNFKQTILNGSGDKVWKTEWHFKNKTREGIQNLSSKWIGLCNLVNDEFYRKLNNKNIGEIRDLMVDKPCECCNGGRLKNELLEIKINGKSIVELSNMSVVQSLDFLQNISLQNCSAKEKILIDEIVKSVKKKVEIMSQLGIDYLSVNRPTSTLSGGEFQRLSIAGAFSAKLSGVCYILDEPTNGLHQRDVCKLVKILRKLVENGNTVVVVEHDRSIIENADYIIEIGPEAGANGGRIMFSGKPSDIKKSSTLSTAKILYQQNLKTSFAKNDYVKFGVKSAFANNLKNIDVDFVFNGITAITGVSGSGKTSLMRDVAYASAKKQKAVLCADIFGFDKFDNICYLNQDAAFSNSLSSPATFIGFMDYIRDVFADTEIAKNKGLKKSAFSYIHSDGKCPECNGCGVKKIHMDFMSDIFVECPSCQGLRYRQSSLSCLYKGVNIGEVMKMTIGQAAAFFDGEKVLHEILVLLVDLGLGHLQIGQYGNTISGGESQRLKLALNLINSKSCKNLYLFDEPTNGLHYLDIQNLIKIFDKLIENGNSIVFIEHNEQLVSIADKVVELGPCGGEKGGYLI